MRLLCLHEDTVQALQRLGTAVDDLTPRGLWNTPYHLVSMTPEQRDALQRLRVSMDDITPTALRDGAGVAATSGASQTSAGAGARGASAGAATTEPGGPLAHRLVRRLAPRLDRVVQQLDEAHHGDGERA